MFVEILIFLIFSKGKNGLAVFDGAEPLYT